MPNLAVTRLALCALLALAGCQAAPVAVVAPQDDDAVQANCLARAGRIWMFSDPDTGDITEGCAPYELPPP